MITVKNLSKMYDDFAAVSNLSFSVPRGETLCFIGTSGCGKTTTLKMLNRLIEPSSGEILLSGKNILQQNPITVRREMGYVMQRGGLFPHWTVKRNIALVPTLQRWSDYEIEQRVDELLDLVNLDPKEYRDRYPAQLSGGQRQRVGIARAFAADPPVILMDEPFSALDPVTRKQLQKKCIELKEKFDKTILFVTHDLEEAFLLADKIMIMDCGKMEQYDTPENIKSKPATKFVEKFLQSHEQDNFMKKVVVIFALLISLYANDTIKVGSKIFPESRLLGEIVSILIEQNTSLKVERKLWMGGTKICFEALNSGALDIYCEYTGTAWNVILKKKGRESADTVYEIVKKEFIEDYDLHWMKPFGFNNTYVMVVNKEWPINTISEMATVQDKIKLALNHEFMHREDGFYAMCKFYGLNLPNVTTMEHSLAYKAVSEKTVDSTSAYSTDGKLVKYNLKALRDDKNFFPPYFAAPIVYGETLRKHPKLKPLLNKLSGRLDDEKMTKLNYRVEIEREDFYDVAYEFLKAEGLIKKNSTKKERESEMVKLTRQHLFLVAVSTILAILLGVPLGILIGKFRSLASLILGITGVMQTIPSLAILAIMVPIFGIGVVPSIIALTLYALLPIIRNAYTGIISVDPELIEAARAMGLTNMQILTMLEIPLSTTIIMAGVRTATVICVGTATLAAFIGGGGLGEFILTGINLDDNVLILCGTIPAAVLAIFVDFLLSRIEKWIEPQGLKIQRELSSQSTKNMHRILWNYKPPTGVIPDLIRDLGVLKSISYCGFLLSQE